MKKVPTKLPAISSALRQQLTRRFAQIFAEVHQRAGQRVFALGQKLRCFTEHVGIIAGMAQRTRMQVDYPEKAGVVCRSCQPADAPDHNVGGQSTQCPGPQAVYDERLPSSRWQPEGVSQRPGPPYTTWCPISAVRSMLSRCGVEVEGGILAHTRLVAQSATAHFRRLSMSGVALLTYDRGPCLPIDAGVPCYNAPRDHSNTVSPAIIAPSETECDHATSV